MTTHANPLLNQQAAAIAPVIQQQAQQVEAALTAQGQALVEQMAAQAMQQAAANAAGAMALRAQELLTSMASAASADLQALDTLAPAEVEPAHVIDLQAQPIALPQGGQLELPAAVRMSNALPASGKPSASAKRRARRAAVKASEEQQG